MTERLQKIIAQAGVCSRREAEQKILSGQVWVNNKPVTELGAKADITRDTIEVDGVLISKKAKSHTLAFNKPKGVVCTMVAQRGEKIIFDLIPKKYGRVYPVGRLDKESEGLILITNNGQLANTVMKAQSKIKKTYRVTLRKKSDTPERALEEVSAVLNRVAHLGDGAFKPDDWKVFSVESNGDILTECVIHSGKHHIIRRTAAFHGYTVKRLVRTKIGHISLKGIPKAELVELSDAQIQAFLTHS